ncbi:MAG: sugar phosphate isomerase/epimerase [Opitutaceae bacterium]|nr:sugar phosphate isomerase/epimerase [Opitutaceae bacterium]
MLLPLLLTFSTLGCPDFTLEQSMALAEKHQLAAIELRALGGTLDVPAYLAQTYGTPAQLAARMADAPVRIVALDTSLRLVGNTPADREAFLRFVPWAEALGVKWLRVIDGGRAAGADEIASAVATMRWWRELRGKNGWRTDIMIETHDMLVTAPAIRRFLAAVPDAAMLWDTHNTWKRGGEDPLAVWRIIKTHVVHIHVKDSISRPSEKYPFTYVLPGTGEFPMAPLRAVLRSEYQGPVSLEWEKVWHPYLQPLDDALTAAEKNRWWP